MNDTSAEVDPHTTESFGRALARLRKQHGYSTQQGLADAIGRSVGLLGKIEAGRSRPGEDTLGRIIDVLDLDDAEVGLVHRLWREAGSATDLSPTPADLDRKLDAILAALAELADIAKLRDGAVAALVDRTPPSMPRPDRPATGRK